MASTHLKVTTERSRSPELPLGSDPGYFHLEAEAKHNVTHTDTCACVRKHTHIHTQRKNLSFFREVFPTPWLGAGAGVAELRAGNYFTVLMDSMSQYME